MKILIIPKPDISFYDLFYDAGWMPKPNLPKLKWYYKFDQVAYEYNYYSDICRVNNGTTHMLGKLHPEYSKPPPENCTNPSARLSPAVPSINYSAAIRDISSYDVILCSSWSVGYAKELLKRARKIGVLVAILDHADHEDIFLNRDPLELTRKLSHDSDFDVYFKKDLPLGMKEKNILPLGPDPVRIESYTNNMLLPHSKRTTSIFFSGILNKPVTKDQRDGLLQAIANKIESSYINIIDVDNHYAKKGMQGNSEINERMSNSRIVLCAPGRAWTTTRLTTSAIFGCVPMVAEPDCELIEIGENIREMALVYSNLRYLKGVERQKSIDIAIEKLREISSNYSKMERMSQLWREHVLTHHTTLARANYIIKSIEALI